MRHPFLEGLRGPLHISHRGGAALYPENTLYAFRQAVEAHHTDMLELDVHATKDGVLVVAHDPTLDRCTDAEGPLSALTFAELQKVDAAARFESLRGKGITVPSFESVLAAFPAMRFNVELKSADGLEPLVALVKKSNSQARLCLGSADDALGAALHRALPEACHFFPTNALAAFVLPLKSSDPPQLDERYAVLDMPYAWEGVTMFDADVARAAASHGLWVNVWTVDDPDEMRTAIAAGVGGVMTDRPDVLRRVLAG